MKLVWTEAAMADRSAIMDFISIDNVFAAIDTDDRIENAAETLLLFPEAGRVGRVSGTRELVVPRTNYVIGYTANEKDVLILRVLHGAQSWPNSLT
jgi:toxin ParE1/3/4